MIINELNSKQQRQDSCSLSVALSRNHLTGLLNAATVHYANCYPGPVCMC